MQCYGKITWWFDDKVCNSKVHTLATRALVSYPGSGNTWIRYLIGFNNDSNAEDDDDDSDSESLELPPHDFPKHIKKGVGGSNKIIEK